MDEIRKLLREALRDHWETPVELLVEDILQRLIKASLLKGPGPGRTHGESRSHGRGPEIPIKELSDLPGWLK